VIKKFIISNLYYFSSNSLNIILGLFRGGVIANLLGPALYGAWNTFTLAQSYANLSHLGLLSAFDRDYPYYLGKGDKNHAEAIKSNVFTAVSALSILCGMVLLGLSFFVRTISNSKEFAFSFRILAVIIVLSQIWEFYILYLRNIKDFKMLSIGRGLYWTLFTALAVPLTYYFSFKGLIVALLLSFCPFIVYVFIKFIKSIKIAIDGKMILALLAVGWPFLGMQGLGMVFNTFDRLVILSYFDLKILGQYSFALFLIGFLKAAMEPTVYVMRPFILQKAGRHANNCLPMKKDLLLINGLAAYVIPVIVVLLFILIEPLIGYVFPQYIASISIARIMCWGILPVCIAMFTSPFIVASNNQKYLFYFNLMNVILILSLIFLLSYLNRMTITNIVIAMCLSQYIGSFVTLMAALLVYQTPLKEAVLISIRLFAPFLILMTIVTFISGHTTRFNVVTRYDYMGIQCLIAVLIFLPLSWTKFKNVLKRMTNA